MMHGKTIIATQPADQAAETIKILQMEGARVYSLPMIKTQTLLADLQTVKKILTPGNYDLLIFTSRKGVKGFFENIRHRTGSYSIPSQIKIAVVGPSTAEELKLYNQKTRWVNPGNDAKSLAAYLLDEIIAPHQKILLALGNKAPGFLQKTLSEKAMAERINVYETIEITDHDPEIARLIGQKAVDMCLFTSPSGFFAFLNSFTDIKGLNLAAIGETTASAITEKGYTVAATAEQPSAQHLVAAIKKFFGKQNK
jgi:uroporphyrinogen III methyltransferase/synthase